MKRIVSEEINQCDLCPETENSPSFDKCSACGVDCCFRHRYEQGYQVMNGNLLAPGPFAKTEHKLKAPTICTGCMAKAFPRLAALRTL